MKSKNKKFTTSLIILPTIFALLLPAHVFAETESADPVYPNDTFFYKQRAAYDMVNLPEAWSETTGNDDVTIAVIDSGIDMQHPDLQENIWRNQDEIAGNNIDDDNNGYVDDVYGYDFSLTKQESIESRNHNRGVINIGDPTNFSKAFGVNLDFEICKMLFEEIGDIYLQENPDASEDEVNQVVTDLQSDCDEYIEDPDFNDKLFEAFPEIDKQDASIKALNRLLKRIYSTHGTQVSSVIAAPGDNGQHISGAMWDAQIMNLRISELWKVHETRIAQNLDLNKYDLKVAEAIMYAVNNDVDVINMSIEMGGSPQDRSMIESALEYAYENDVVVVAAAGNGKWVKTTYTGWQKQGVDLGSEPRMPACSDYALTVGSVQTDINPKSATRSSFSNYGECVDVSAPGEDIYALYHGWWFEEFPHYADEVGEVVETRRWHFENGASRPYKLADGTSLSAPIVAGIAGLLKSQYPEATPDEIYRWIKESTTTPYYPNRFKAHPVNAEKALEFARQEKGEPNKEKEGEVLGESTVNTDHISNGALIRAEGDDDVYIVKYVGTKKFKRLVLSPSVFNSYGHLYWDDIMVVSPEVADAFETSDLVRATVAGDPRVYKLYPQGDTGEKRWVKSAEVFNAHGWDWDAIYTINETDRDSYIEGDPFYQ